MLKKLNERNTIFNYNDLSKPIKNGYECPNCKSELFDTNPMVILTSNPPQKTVHCEKCAYRGYRYV